MAVELDHSFATGKSTEENWQTILDLDRVIPAVEGGKVIERTSPTSAKAEIAVKMGAMSMTFAGTVDVTERDDCRSSSGPAGQITREGRCRLRQRGRDVRAGRRGGTIHTSAQISGKAASMGEGVMGTVLDALIENFTDRLKSA